MEKYGNKSPLMRFIHKNTGYIICGAVLAIAVPLLINEQSHQEFFEKWTCPVLWSYVMSDHPGSKYPNVDQLTAEQKEKLDKIMEDCSAFVPKNNTVLKYEK